MTLSIIIVNWNSKDYVRKCLASLEKQTAQFDVEIIVVDSGSFDGCDVMLANEFPKTVFVQGEKNLGFGRANNLGADRAIGEFVWFLNPDTEVVAAAATTLLHTLKNNTNAGLVGARLLNTDGTLQTSCVQSLPTPINQALDAEFLRRIFPHSRLWGIAALQSRTGTIEVQAVSGACMMSRREVFDRIGRFDPRYFMYCEDMDLCLRIQKAGLKVLYVPEAEVLHHGGGSSQKQFSKFSTVLTREAVAYYLRSNFGPSHAWYYRLCLGLSAFGRLCVLFPANLFGYGTTNFAKSVPLQKWQAILRWCLGGEQWAKTYSREHQTGASPGSSR